MWAEKRGSDELSRDGKEERAPPAPAGIPAPGRPLLSSAPTGGSRGGSASGPGPPAAARPRRAPLPAAPLASARRPARSTLRRPRQPGCVWLPDPSDTISLVGGFSASPVRAPRRFRRSVGPSRREPCSAPWPQGPVQPSRWVERPALRAPSEGPAGESRLKAALTPAVGASGAMPPSLWLNILGPRGIGHLRQSQSYDVLDSEIPLSALDSTAHHAGPAPDSPEVLDVSRVHLPGAWHGLYGLRCFSCLDSNLFIYSSHKSFHSFYPVPGTVRTW